MGENDGLFLERFLAQINHELKLRMQRGEQANMVIFMTLPVYKYLLATRPPFVPNFVYPGRDTVYGWPIRLVNGDDFSYWVGYEVFAGVTVPEEEEQHGTQ